MKSRPFRRGRGPARASKVAGFSLIEVLISLLVLGLGLLGLAMLQTTNLRLAQSANSRTTATNLAYELMDNIRANRMLASNYGGEITAAAPAAGTGCSTSDAWNPVAQKAEFACKLHQQLGTGAKANVVVGGDKELKSVTITINWADDKRWRVDGTGTEFVVESKL
ncbi:type IV pilus modification protein PilV [Lysobacter sp. CA199]|uniref:type IV pilus modification protein PilV n=1 Tax=Lysobacter sp. CA199 TaxID=3455608 RepID=UPI003F8D3F97